MSISAFFLTVSSLLYQIYHFSSLFFCFYLCFLLHNSLYICPSLSNRYSLIKMMLGSFLRHLPQVGSNPIHYTPSPCASPPSFSPVILSSLPPLALLNSPHSISLPAQSGLIHRKLSKCNNPTEDTVPGTTCACVRTNCIIAQRLKGEK